MNNQARQAINDAIVTMTQVIDVNTDKRGGLKDKNPYTPEDLVAYARAILLLSQALSVGGELVKESPKGDDAQ